MSEHKFWRHSNDPENPACRVCGKGRLHALHGHQHSGLSWYDHCGACAAIFDAPEKADPDA